MYDVKNERVKALLVSEQRKKNLGGESEWCCVSSKYCSSVWECCLLCGVRVVCESWRRMIIYYRVRITKDQLNRAKQHNATLCMESSSCCFVWEKSTGQKGCCFCTFLLCFCDNKGDPLIIPVCVQLTFISSFCVRNKLHIVLICVDSGFWESGAD